MRIAVSGTHFMGKSTLIDDFIKKHSAYTRKVEPYYQLLDEKTVVPSLEPDLDSILEQLDYSINQLNESESEENIIFDRCPVDFIAYAICALEQDDVDIDETEVAERFLDVKKALNNLDLIVFLPITKEYIIDYTEENPNYRKSADKCFKKIYRDDLYDIFPKYGHPKIIELWGDRLTRINKLESYLENL